MIFKRSGGWAARVAGALGAVVMSAPLTATADQIPFADVLRHEAAPQATGHLLDDVSHLPSRTPAAPTPGGGLGCRVVWFNRGATGTDLLVLGLLLAGWACLRGSSSEVRRATASAPPGDS